MKEMRCTKHIKVSPNRSFHCEITIRRSSEAILGKRLWNREDELPGVLVIKDLFDNVLTEHILTHVTGS